MSRRRVSDVHGRLYVIYHETNEREFGGLLPTIPIRIDTASRPGKINTLAYLWTDDYVGAPRYIVVDEDAACDPTRSSWGDVVDTLKHEMIHVWQAATGRAVNHGADFKRMAKRLGVSARAVD